MTRQTTDAVQITAVQFPPSLGELSEMASADLTRHVGETNTLYAATLAAYEAAAQLLGDMLTEQIVRRVLLEVPTASTLQVVPVETTFDTHQFGEATETLVAAQVLAADGTVAGVLAPLSPVHYMLERLSPLMDMAPAELDLPARSWAGVLALS